MKTYYYVFPSSFIILLNFFLIRYTSMFLCNNKARYFSTIPHSHPLIHSNIHSLIHALIHCLFLSTTSFLLSSIHALQVPSFQQIIILSKDGVLPQNTSFLLPHLKQKQNFPMNILIFIGIGGRRLGGAAVSPSCAEIHHMWANCSGVAEYS